jgi:polysaccharide export outer membrane protein
MRLWLLFAGLISLASCVSNKKITLLQKDDVYSKGTSLPIDSVVRTYALDTFQYRIQPNDILSVRFESLTAKEYDFFAKEETTQNQLNMSQGNALLIGELVDEFGTISFPVLGKIHVAGMTVFEIQNKLAVLADQYVETPIVKLR